MLDVTILGALAGGLIVFFSPCILPIVPFYLSYRAGASMSEIRPFAAAVLLLMGLLFWA